MNVSQQQQALEVAKLAAMVGSQLKAVDQLTVEPSSNPANKININNFIANVNNPNANVRPAKYLTSTPNGFAPPPPESFVQSMVPDIPSTVPVSLSPTESIFATQAPQTSEQPIQQKQENQKFELRKEYDKPLITRSDIDSIRNSLKNIDKSLSGLLDYFKNSKKTDE